MIIRISHTRQYITFSLLLRTQPGPINFVVHSPASQLADASAAGAIAARAGPRYQRSLYRLQHSAVTGCIKPMLRAHELHDKYFGNRHDNDCATAQSILKIRDNSAYDLKNYRN